MHTATAIATPPHALPPVIAQDYARYSAEDHAVWQLLYQRRMDTLRQVASTVFLEGMACIGLDADRVPDLADVNARLAPRTGWAAIGVSGFVPARQFFASLAHRRFPTTLGVRPRAQLDYLPEPDIFHDVFGHVPLHANPVFADFLQRFGQLAADAADDRDVTALARLFWFTVEFGLVQERGDVRIYGSGLVSSHGDAANALGATCDRRPFSLDAVIAQPFEIDHVQEVLFVLDDFSQLFDAVDEYAARMDRN
jgi:phenylalanine-4-hydroxylase